MGHRRAKISKLEWQVNFSISNGRDCSRRVFSIHISCQNKQFLYVNGSMISASFHALSGYPKRAASSVSLFPVSAQTPLQLIKREAVGLYWYDVFLWTVNAVRPFLHHGGQSDRNGSLECNAAYGVLDVLERKELNLILVIASVFFSRRLGLLCRRLWKLLLQVLANPTSHLISSI